MVTRIAWVGHWDPFSFLPFFGTGHYSNCLGVLSSGQSGLTKYKILQILFAGDLWPTQSRIPSSHARTLACHLMVVVCFNGFAS